MKSFLIFYLILIFLFVEGCNIFENTNNDIDLFEVTPISANEAILEIKGQRGDSVAVFRGKELIHSFKLTSFDTLVSDNGLDIGTSYIWTLHNKDLNLTIERSASTIDNISKWFEWEIYNIRDNISGYLNDVHIINENDILIAGRIFVHDTTGQSEPDEYNFVRWDGEKWKLVKLTVECDLIYQNCSDPKRQYLYETSSVFAFGPSNIWVTARRALHHFDGNTWTAIPGLNMSWVHQIWGSNPTESLWFAGGFGYLRKYNSGQWKEIKTGIELDIFDMNSSGQGGIIAVTGDWPEGRKGEILQFEKGSDKPKFLSTRGMRYSPRQLWIDEGGIVYTSGGDILRKPNISSTSDWLKVKIDSTNSTGWGFLDANDVNDIIAAGSRGRLVHFNGLEWKSFKPDLDYVSYGDLEIKDNTAVAIGNQGNNVLIMIGRR